MDKIRNGITKFYNKIVNWVEPVKGYMRTYEEGQQLAAEYAVKALEEVKKYEKREPIAPVIVQGVYRTTRAQKVADEILAGKVKLPVPPDESIEDTLNMLISVAALATITEDYGLKLYPLGFAGREGFVPVNGIEPIEFDAPEEMVNYLHAIGESLVSHRGFIPAARTVHLPEKFVIIEEDDGFVVQGTQDNELIEKFIAPVVESINAHIGKLVQEYVNSGKHVHYLSRFMMKTVSESLMIISPSDETVMVPVGCTQSDLFRGYVWNYHLVPIVENGLVRAVDVNIINTSETKAPPISRVTISSGHDEFNNDLEEYLRIKSFWQIVLSLGGVIEYESLHLMFDNAFDMLDDAIGAALDETAMENS